MNLGFSKLIQSIESELKMKYIPECIRWNDEHFDNEWSNVVDEFDLALSVSIESGNYDHARREGEKYRMRCLAMIERFKNDRSGKSTDFFLENLTLENS